MRVNLSAILPSPNDFPQCWIFKSDSSNIQESYVPAFPAFPARAIFFPRLVKRFTKEYSEPDENIDNDNCSDYDQLHLPVTRQVVLPLAPLSAYRYSLSQLARGFIAQHMVTTSKQMSADNVEEELFDLLVFRPILLLQSPPVLDIVQPKISGHYPCPLLLVYQDGCVTLSIGTNCQPGGAAAYFTATERVALAPARDMEAIQILPERS